jgi:hypothetical protein
MMSTSKKIKNTIITLGIAGAIAVASFVLEEAKPTPEHLKLKAPIEKILNSREVDMIVGDPDGIINASSSTEPEKNPIPQKEKIRKTVKIRKYDYISETKVSGEFLFKDRPYTNAKLLEKKGDEQKVAFYSGDHFYKDDKGDVYEIKQGATTTVEEWEKQAEPSLINRIFEKKAYADVTDYYAGAGDGRTQYVQIGASWATLIAGAGTDVRDDYSPENMVYYRRNGPGDTWKYVMRGIIPVDLSALSGTVTGVTFYLYGSAKSNACGDTDINIYSASPASYTALTGTDYATGGTTAFSTQIDYTDLNTTGWNTWEFNAAGISYIDGAQGGWTAIMPRDVAYDVGATTPPSGSTNATTRFEVVLSEGANDPYLEITYTTGGGGGGTTGQDDGIIWYE